MGLMSSPSSSLFSLSHSPFPSSPSPSPDAAGTPTSESGGTAEAWGCQIDGEEVGTTSTVEHVGVMVHRRVCKEKDKAGRPAREGGRWAGRWRRGRQAPPKSKSVIADTTSNARRGRRRGGWSGGGDGASSGLHGLPHPGHGRKPCLSSPPPSSGSGCATHRPGCHVTSSTPTPTGSPLASSSTTTLHYHAVPTTPSQLRRSTTNYAAPLPTSQLRRSTTTLSSLDLGC